MYVSYGVWLFFLDPAFTAHKIPLNSSHHVPALKPAASIGAINILNKTPLHKLVNATYNPAAPVNGFITFTFVN